MQAQHIQSPRDGLGTIMMTVTQSNKSLSVCIYTKLGERDIYDSVDKGMSACDINNVFLKGEEGNLIVVHAVVHFHIHNHLNTLYAYVFIC